MEKEEFLKFLTSIQGIGKAKAEAIYNSGYDSVEKLREAKVEDLTKIKGINEELAKKIKEKVGTEETEKKEEKKEIKEETKEEKPKKKMIPRIKPKLDERIKDALEKRRVRKEKEPEFLRQEWFRYKRLEECWRRPKGLHSKMRKGLKYRPARVKIGYRGPKLARNLHPSGFEEVLVYRVEDLNNINPEKQAVRIGGTVGVRKRIEIVKRADELGIRVLNRGEL